MERRAVDLARRRGVTLGVAESFTGGRVQDRLTDVPGASAVFLGGLVAYDDSIKRRILGVKATTIRRHGAVSRACAVEMAKGARRRFGASIGLATTGIAGPTGARPGKPVGLCFVALAAARRTFVQRRVFGGGREAVKEKATRLALRMLVQSLRNR